MLAFTLELVNLVLLLCGVLGYEFRHNRLCLAGGGLLAVVLYLSFLFLPEEIIIQGYYAWMIIPLIIVVLLIDEKYLKLLLMCFSIRIVFGIFDRLCFGAWILTVNGEIGSINLGLSYNVSQIVLIICVTICIICTTGKRNFLHHQIAHLNGLWFIPFIIFGMIVQYNPWYSGFVSDEVAQITQGKNLIKSGTLGILLIIVFVLLYILICQRRELKRSLSINEKCILEQAEQYRLLNQRDNDLRQFKHDYNDHITVLHDLARKGDTESMASYAEKIGEIKEGLRLIYTNSAICDAVLNRYDSICREKNIPFNVKGVLPDNISITDPDLCVILSNGIKNAVEATEKCAEKRKISVEIKNSDDHAFIIIRNPSAERLIFEESGLASTKEDKDNHGYGTKTMVEIARGYGGDVSWSIDGDVVTTTIMLKIKETE